MFFGGIFFFSVLAPLMFLLGSQRNVGLKILFCNLVTQESLCSLSLFSAVYTAHLSSVLRQYQSPQNVTNLHLEEHVCHFLYATIKTSSLAADIWVVGVFKRPNIQSCDQRGRNVIPGIGWTSSHAEPQNESRCLTRTWLLSDMPDLNQAGKHRLDQHWCHSWLLL